MTSARCWPLHCAASRMVGLPELLTLGDVERPDEAVHHLVADGVAVRLGDLVGVTRAAVRYSELTAR